MDIPFSRDHLPVLAFVTGSVTDAYSGYMFSASCHVKDHISIKANLVSGNHASQSKKVFLLRGRSDEDQ